MASSMFNGQISDTTDAERVKAYQDAAIQSQEHKVRSVDVSKITKDRLRLESGKIIEIYPSFVADQVRIMLERLRGNMRYSFVKPYLSKPIIWTYEANTAFTDGIRVYISPVFATQLLNAGKKEYNSFIKGITDPEELQSPETNFKKNELLTKYIRYVIVHEVFHILYNHARRAILKYGSNPTKEEHERANIAMDLEINRDIENCFPDLEGSTETIDGIWYKNPRFYKSDGTVFIKDIWEDIWDDWTNNNKDFDTKNPLNNQNVNPTQKSQAKQGAYSDGWRKAVDAIKSKQIDPKKINV